MRFDMDAFCIGENATLMDALGIIDKNASGAALVLNSEKQVVGVITDGDIRRALLKGCGLMESIFNIYNRKFKFAKGLESKKKVKEFMIKNKIRQFPILDDKQRLVDIFFIDDLITYDKKENYVFIMAGGLGTRLKPLTDNIPKPMLKVGEKPILQHIIEQFREYGFVNFIISLNYMSNIIESYFKDGKKFNVNINYVHEEKKLGTAVSIRLAEALLEKPFIVINGDILTGLDFDAFLNHHLENGFDVTAGVRSYEFTVPYGVMVTEELLIKGVKEKPTYNFYINGGIYAVNPEIINNIPPEEPYNMTDLINDSVQKGRKTGIYQITEYWADIGQMEDYKKANEDVKIFF